MNVVQPLRPSPQMSRSDETFVIVGGGQAGVQAASTLRERGFAGRLVMLADEERLPYMRPPLSKKFLSAEQSEERLYFRPAAYFEANGIDVRTGVKVAGIDRATTTLRLASGATLRYDRLLLATGSRPRRLSVPGGSDPRLHYLRTADDAIRLRGSLRPGSHLVIIGAGYVGLEVAATAVTAGVKVTILEAGERVLGRVTTPALSEFVAGMHRGRGVDLRLGAKVVAFSGTDRLEVSLEGEPPVAADAAVIGIGAVPNDDLARAAGLACDDGIVVDAHAQTSDPNIYAAGDCTRHPNALYDRRLRLESVQNAIDQATVAATCMSGGQLSYCRVPWFWSNQYDSRLQSAGLFEGHDEIVHKGDRATGRFALLYIKAGQLVAIDAVNMPGEYASARRTIAQRGEVAFDLPPGSPSLRLNANTADGPRPSTVARPQLAGRTLAR